MTATKVYRPKDFKSFTKSFLLVTPVFGAVFLTRFDLHTVVEMLLYMCVFFVGFYWLVLRPLTTVTIDNHSIKGPLARATLRCYVKPRLKIVLDNATQIRKVRYFYLWRWLEMYQIGPDSSGHWIQLPILDKDELNEISQLASKGRMIDEITFTFQQGFRNYYICYFGFFGGLTYILAFLLGYS